MLKTKFYNSLAKMTLVKQQFLATVAAAVMAVSFVPAQAFAGESSTMKPILTNIGNLIITAIAIVGVIFTVKAVLKYMKDGNGSIGQIVTTVLVTLLFIGLVVVLVNADTLSATFQPIANKGVETAGDLGKEILGTS